MNRTRWIAGAVLAGLGFVGGCSHSDCSSCGGSMWDRLCSRTRRPVVTTEEPCYEGGPILGEAGNCATGNCANGNAIGPVPNFTAPPPQQAFPPAGQSTLPPLSPTPAYTPQAQPVPAGPTASTKLR